MRSDVLGGSTRPKGWFSEEWGPQLTRRADFWKGGDQLAQRVDFRKGGSSRPKGGFLERVASTRPKGGFSEDRASTRPKGRFSERGAQLTRMPNFWNGDLNYCIFFFDVLFVSIMNPKTEPKNRGSFFPKHFPCVALVKKAQTFPPAEHWLKKAQSFFSAAHWLKQGQKCFPCTALAKEFVSNWDFC